MYSSNSARAGRQEASDSRAYQQGTESSCCLRQLWDRFSGHSSVPSTGCEVFGMCEGGHAAEGLQAGLCPEPAWAQPSGELQMHRMASRGQQQAVPPVMLTPAPGKALLYLVLI